MRAAEKRRADFRARYIEILPNVATPGVPALEAARNNVSALDGRLQDVIMERDALKDEVDRTPPMLVAETMTQQMALGMAPVAKTRLEEAEDQLRMLLLKDTENHPDVIAQRKLIELLKTRRRLTRQGRRRRRRGVGDRAACDAWKPVGAKSGLRPAQGKADRRRHAGVLDAATARRRRGVPRQAGKDPAGAARPGRGIREYRPRL